MTTRLSVIAVIMLLWGTVTATGCTTSATRPQATATQSTTVEVTDGGGNNITRDVTMAVDDTLKVTLSANHSIPFYWAAQTQIGDPAILQQTSHQYVAGNTTGGPGKEFWTFKAFKTGTTTITNHETDIAGDPGTSPLRTFTAKVTVQ